MLTWYAKILMEYSARNQLKHLGESGYLLVKAANSVWIKACWIALGEK